MEIFRSLYLRIIKKGNSRKNIEIFWWKQRKSFFCQQIITFLKESGRKKNYLNVFLKFVSSIGIHKYNLFITAANRQIPWLILFRIIFSNKCFHLCTWLLLLVTVFHRIWEIMALHSFLYIVNLSKVFPLLSFPSYCSAIHLHKFS